MALDLREARASEHARRERDALIEQTRRASRQAVRRGYARSVAWTLVFLGMMFATALRNAERGTACRS
jgi:hypothetical protein